MATLTLSDCMLNNNPFDEEGYGEVPFVQIDRILGEQIVIEDVKGFENDKGKGVFILMRIAPGLAKQLDVEGEHIFICTHSTSLCGTLSSPSVIDVFERGDCISTCIVKRKSTKSDRMVYAFE